MTLSQFCNFSFKLEIDTFGFIPTRTVVLHRLAMSFSIPVTRWLQLACHIKAAGVDTVLVQQHGPQAKQCGVEPNRDITEAY